MKKASRSLGFALVLILFMSTIPAIQTKADYNPYSAWISIFDPAYYNANNAAAAAYAGGDVTKLWQYFVNVGIPKCDQASAEFNVLIYAKNYPELVQAFGGNIIQYYVHYATAGKAAGLNARTLNGQSASVEIYRSIGLEELQPFADGGAGLNRSGTTDNFGNAYSFALKGVAGSNDTDGWAKYYLGGQGSYFTATVAAYANYYGGCSPESKGLIRIYGDGRLLWSNESVTIETHPFQIKVDISGVQDLQIEMRKGKPLGRYGVMPLLGNPVILVKN